MGIFIKFYCIWFEFCFFFIIFIGKNYIIKLEEVILWVCKCKINLVVIFSYVKMLKIIIVKYLYKKSIVKMYILVKGLFNVFIENMFLGIRLDRMYVVFVLLEVVVGVFIKNFYNFRYYNIN